MSIYTKTGDKGTTSLFGGKRVSKNAHAIECNGVIDELSSFVGFAKISVKDTKLKDILTIVQKDLYTCMAVVAGSSNTSLVSLSENIKMFEKTIDTLDSKLPELKDFIIPQNNEPSTRLHIARTVCRRVERYITQYTKTISQEEKSDIVGKKSSAILMQYFNRLSDLLFIMARFESDEEEIAKA